MELKTRARRSVAVFLLAIVTLWPGAHIFLTAYYEWNPWKFFGFAMYIAPSLAFESHVYDISTPDAPELSPLSEEEYEALSLWMYEVSVLGFAARPEPVATVVFAERPELPAIRVEFTELFLRPNIGRIGRRSYYWDIVRLDSGEYEYYASRDDIWLDEFEVPAGQGAGE